MTGAVVVVSHAPGEWLAPCLESVRDQADHVVLVDNGSPGALASTVGARSGIEVVRSPTNTGFTGGVALGLDRVLGRDVDVIGLLNDDAVAGPGWLAAAAGVLGDDGVGAVAAKVLMTGWYRPVSLPDEVWHAPGDGRDLGRQVRSVTVEGVERLGAVGGAGIHRLEGADGDRWRWTSGPGRWWVPVGDDPDAEVRVDGAPVEAGRAARVVNSAGTYLRADGYAGDHGLMAPDGGTFDVARDCFAASGVALVTTPRVLASVGGLEGSYFAYYEDVDWSWRAHLAGYRIRYEPQAQVTHRRGATSGGESLEWVRRLAERNRTSTMVRNAPVRVAAAHLQRRLRDSTDPALRASVLRRLPGALAWRARRTRGGASAVWDRWAGVDLAWVA